MKKRMKLTKAEKKWIMDTIDGLRDTSFNIRDYGEFSALDWNEEHYDGSASEFELMKSIYKKMMNAQEPPKAEGGR